MKKKNEKILCIIPARSGSKGLRNKNFKRINNIPLIGYTINLAKKIKHIDKLFVSTDSKKILNYAKKNGCEAPYLRPKKISGDKSTIDEVCSNVLNYYKKRGENFDIILVLQPTSPLRKLNSLKKVVEKILNNKNLIAVTTFCKCSNSHPNYIYKKNNNFFNPIIKKKIKRRQDFKTYYFRTGVAYAVRSSFFLKYKKLYPKKPYGIILDDYLETINIDTITDFKLAKYIIESNQN